MVLGGLRELKLPFRVIGGGSNVLISSSGLDEVVVKLGGAFKEVISEERRGAGRMYVGAGASLMRLSREVSQGGLSGLEFAGGIPATVGGAVVMNAGAHGGEMASVLDEIDILSYDGHETTLPMSAITYEYRRVHLPPHVIVIGAALRLTPSTPAACEDRRRECLEYRKQTQPLSEPSLGSIFRNPFPDRSAGYLLEQSGLKGESCGEAAYSTKHANWIVNPTKRARSEDIIALIERGKHRVRERFDVSLEPEIRIWSR
jgi:UDP-N-acetylmuramate dehydrogenase